MSQSNIKSLGSDLLVLLLLAILASGIGLLINRFRSTPLPVRPQTPAERLQDSVSRMTIHRDPGIVIKAVATVQKLPEFLSLSEFSTNVDARQILILDARPAPFYRLSHVPGALSLPREDFVQGYATLKARLDSNHVQPIVIYCSDASCEDSKLVRDSLRKLGYENLSLFEPGWSAWSEFEKKQEH
jgi:rhodanese-related sulfurtransferase/Na+-transporting methylmalonyl-CoA/oxaloacetate decarboxylase gamma subunit